MITCNEYGSIITSVSPKGDVCQANIFDTDNRNVRFMCSNCYSLSKMYKLFTSFDFKILHAISDTGQDIEESLVSSEVPIFETVISECDNCKEENLWVPIDAPIAEVISDFNKSGLITKYSCSGHIKKDSLYVAYIMFKDKDFAEKVFSELPDDDIFWNYWHINTEDNFKDVYMIEQITTGFDVDKILMADHVSALHDVAPKLCSIAEGLTS